MLTDEQIQKVEKLNPQNDGVVPSMKISDANILLKLEMETSPSEAFSLNITTDRIKTLALSAVANRPSVEAHFVFSAERKELQVFARDESAQEEPSRTTAVPSPRVEEKPDAKKKATAAPDGEEKQEYKVRPITKPSDAYALGYN